MSLTLKGDPMKKIILIMSTLLFATMAKASIYNCEIKSPISKSPEKWNFVFDTQKDNNHIVTLDIENQVAAGCVAVRADKTYLSCVYGTNKVVKTTVTSVIEDGSPVLYLSIENAAGNSTLKCDKQ